MFGGIEKSVRLEHADKRLTFPCLEDYRQLLLSKGFLRSDEALQGRPDLVLEIQTNWHKHGQTGCIFAKILSTDPPGNLWKIVPLVGIRGWSDGDWESRVRDLVRAAMDDANVWLVSLLFPEVAEAHHLRAVLERLASLDGWSMEVSEPARCEVRGELLNVALRVQLPGGDVSSWALGLGPFASMPFTRQAPFTEVVFAVKPKGPMPLHEEANLDHSQAHVADAPVPVVPSAVDGIWQKTKGNKRLHLRGVNDPTAKAKVTFSVPLGAWNAGDPSGSAPEVARA